MARTKVTNEVKPSGKEASSTDQPKKARKPRTVTLPNGDTKPTSSSTLMSRKATKKATTASQSRLENGISKSTSKVGVKKAKAAEKAIVTVAARKKESKIPPVNGEIPDSASRKRGRDQDGQEDDGSDHISPPAKKSRVLKTSVAKPKPKINEVPTQILDVFVAGEGSAGELGLGPAKGVIDVKRPRLNPLLSAKEVGVVQVACGGMHMAALTRDNKILTWGVNDVGALGRDTTWEGGLKSIDEDNSVDSDDEGSGLNPLECTPTPILASDFPEGTTFVKVSAGDSHTLALTDEGLVYGWGQFRKTDGPLGFLPGSDSMREMRPVQLPGLTKITNITSGANHAMAMDSKGTVYIWGGGEQNQLGYHVVQRTGSEHQKSCLKPQPLRTRIKKYLAIYTGLDHSFAIDQKHQVWSWGLNSFGACGIRQGAGDDNSAVHTPSLIAALSFEKDQVTHIAGGQHHSIAITASGKALTWGKVDGAEVGLDMADVPKTSTIQDDKGDARIVIDPTVLPDIDGKAIYASAGPNHSILITNKGQAYGWGFNGTYQLGLGPNTDVPNATWELPEHIDNTAVRGRMLNGCGCGGQFSMWTAAGKV